jgi:PAS domain S-box-containing protein
VENSLDLMCIHDLDGVLLVINLAVARSLGYRVEEGLGRNLREFLSRSVRPMFDDYLQRIGTNPVDSDLMCLQAKDCTRFWLYRNVRYEEPGSLVLILGHALDLTDRILAERALKRSQDDLARARELQWLATVPSETRQGDQRVNGRYPITLELQYKLLNKDRVERLGIGRTLNISSGGVLFEAETPLRATGPIELAMNWPILLAGICNLKLVMRGQIVRSDTNGKVIAVKAKYHEFHTAGVRSPKGRTMTAGAVS